MKFEMEESRNPVPAGMTRTPAEEPGPVILGVREEYRTRVLVLLPSNYLIRFQSKFSGAGLVPNLVPDGAPPGLSLAAG